MNVSEREVIATNQVHFPVMVLVYEIGDDFGAYVVAKIGSAFVDSSEYVEKKTARKYKMYFNKDGQYYFKWNGYKFLLDETLRTF